MYVFLISLILFFIMENMARYSKKESLHKLRDLASGTVIISIFFLIENNIENLPLCILEVILMFAVLANMVNRYNKE